MSKTETAEKTIAESGGIAKTAELLSAGLSKSDIGRLADSGVIVRIRHGFYRLRSGIIIAFEFYLLKHLITRLI